MHSIFVTNLDQFTAFLRELLISKQIELPRLRVMLGEHGRTDSGPSAATSGQVDSGTSPPSLSPGQSLLNDLYERAQPRLSMQKHRRDPSKGPAAGIITGSGPQIEIKKDSIVSAVRSAVSLRLELK